MTYIAGGTIYCLNFCFYSTSPNGHHKQTYPENVCIDLTTVSIKDGAELKENKIEVFPNPTSEILFVKALGHERDINIEIRNVQGKIVINKRFVGDHIDVRYLSSGMYFLSVYGQKGVLLGVAKFVKEE